MYFVVENSIQETDGSYFEAFTALAWKRDNRRMSAVRTAETRAEMLPEKDHDAQSNEDMSDTPDEREQLYIEVLQTIANAVGAPAPGGQVCITDNSLKMVYLPQFFFRSVVIVAPATYCIAWHTTHLLTIRTTFVLFSHATKLKIDIYCNG